MSTVINDEIPPVTRVEVIEAVESAFADAPVARSALRVAAERAGARSLVLELLDELPERWYRRPADLWDVRPDIPIEL